MASQRLRVGLAAVLALGVLAGCAGLLGQVDPDRSTPTLTPAPVPEVTTTPADPPTATATATASVASNGTSRYAALEPTCTRPPGLVIHIQVAALANNDPETNAGIRTTWRFAAPSNREYTGPYENFERIITSSYRPLLDAETIGYGPMNRTDAEAERDVTVTTGAGNSTTYNWRLRKQSGGEYDGCWMTAAVREVVPNATS